MKQNKCLQPLLAAVVLVGAVCSLSGCGNSAQATNEPTTVYVCRKTHDVFVGPAQPTPVRHPSTGETSLMLGFYCQQCQKWLPGPPMEQLQRMRGGFVCPTHKKPMQLDGPVPEDAQRLPDASGETP